MFRIGFRASDPRALQWTAMFWMLSTGLLLGDLDHVIVLLLSI